jgi:hypothetical protein
MMSYYLNFLKGVPILISCITFNVLTLNIYIYIYIYIYGVITFSPMNYQFLLKTPTNYQLDQNRAFNYQTQQFSPLRSIRGLKQTVNGSRDRHVPFYMGACWKMVVVHGGKIGRKLG